MFGEYIFFQYIQNLIPQKNKVVLSLGKHHLFILEETFGLVFYNLFNKLSVLGFSFQYINTFG